MTHDQEWDRCSGAQNAGSAQAGTNVIAPPLANERGPRLGEQSRTDPESKTYVRNQEPPARRGRKGLVALAALLVVALGVGAWLLFPRGDDDWYDDSMSIGTYDGKSRDEIVADLNAQVKENEMNISCAPTIEVDAATGEAVVRMENIAANHVDQRFTLALDSGEVLYESGGVAPGNYVQTVTLDTVPEPGEYSCVVTFQGYDRETHQKKGGSAALAVPLVVT